MNNRLNKPYTLKVLLQYILSVLVLGLLTQGCSGDHFVSNGNGQPYEGVSIDGENVDEDSEIVTPAREISDGGYVQKVFEVEYFCTANQSSYLDHIIFGIHPNGSPLMIVRLLDLSGYSLEWNQDSIKYDILHTIAEGVYFKDIHVEKELNALGGQLTAHYEFDNGLNLLETFSCIYQPSADQLPKRSKE